MGVKLRRTRIGKLLEEWEVDTETENAWHLYLEEGLL